MSINVVDMGAKFSEIAANLLYSRPPPGLFPRLSIDDGYYDGIDELATEDNNKDFNKKKSSPIEINDRSSQKGKSNTTPKASIDSNESPSGLMGEERVGRKYSFSGPFSLKPISASWPLTKACEDAFDEILGPSYGSSLVKRLESDFSELIGPKMKEINCTTSKSNERDLVSDSKADMETPLKLERKVSFNGEVMIMGDIQSSELEMPQSPYAATSAAAAHYNPFNLGLSIYSSPSKDQALQMHQAGLWQHSPSPIRSVLPSTMVTPLVSTSMYHGSPVRPVMAYNSMFPVVNNTYIDRRWGHGSYYNNNDPVEEMAKSHRNAATRADARHTWSGTLPIKQSHKSPVYSNKVFLGGVPWDMDNRDIQQAFSGFGKVIVQRPGQEVNLSHNSQDREKAGYVYIIFESDKQVKALLNSCTHDFSNGGKWYFTISSRRLRSKDVQVIPWNVYDSTFVKNPTMRLDPNKTVFVGALHGMLTAEGLATILDDLFGGVVYVGIDTDKYKYPIGSGRVTFNATKAYEKAIQAAFIDIKATRFHKKIQIDPYLEENYCSHCNFQKGYIFCREVSCMRYLCRMCWDILHVSDSMRRHRPLMRNNKSSKK